MANNDAPEINSTKENIVETNEVKPAPLVEEKSEPANEENSITDDNITEAQAGETDYLSENKNLSAEDIKSNYISELAMEIERRKTYPSEAQAGNHTGTVGISFKIKKDGTFSDIDFKKRNEHQTLNISAIRLIYDIRRFKPLPDELGMNSLDVVINLEYNLEY